MKLDGGNQAQGDIVVFLDCHVKPMENWTEPILANLRENPKRVVVPSITSLDPDTWEEVSDFGGGKKMCLTWNADFVWCNSYPGPYVPIMSGGLLALTRYWWQETGGYDSEMLSWGGENLDQSLRTWLCGGEIMVAEGSRVAHMWRDPAKPKTNLRYAIPTDHVRRNRLRAVTAWLGDWAEKVRSFPEFEDFLEGGRLEVGDLSNVEVFQKKLGCKGFEWYLQHFQDLYLNTGRLPAETYHFRERSTGLCLQYEAKEHEGQGARQAHFALAPCVRRASVQRVQAANAIMVEDDRTGWESPQKMGDCCSGMKIWDLDACIAVYENGGGVNADECDIFGEVPAQRFGYDNAALLWAPGGTCVAPAETAAAMASKPHGPTRKVVLISDTCRAKVVFDASSEGFRLAVAGKGEDGHDSLLCMAMPAMTDEAHEQALQFVPCETAPAESTLFFRWRDHGDGRH